MIWEARDRSGGACSSTAAVVELPCSGQWRLDSTERLICCQCARMEVVLGAYSSCWC